MIDLVKSLGIVKINDINLITTIKGLQDSVKVF